MRFMLVGGKPGIKSRDIYANFILLYIWPCYEVIYRYNLLNQGFCVWLLFQEFIKNSSSGLFNNIYFKMESNKL